MPGVKVPVGGGNFFEGDDVELVANLARDGRALSQIPISVLRRTQF